MQDGENKISRRTLLKATVGLPVLALGGIAADWADITGYEPEVKVSQPIHELVNNFEIFGKAALEKAEAEHKVLLHATTYPMDSVMVENATRAFEKLNRCSYYPGAIYSFVDMIDLTNKKGTYPTYRQSQIGPDGVGWGKGACLFSTLYARAIFPLSCFHIVEAYRHPASYGEAIERYRNQLTINTVKLPLENIDVGVFVNDLSILGVEVVPERSRIDMRVMTEIKVPSGAVTLAIYSQDGVPLRSNPEANFSALTSRDISEQMRDYYFLTATVDKALATEQGLAELRISNKEVTRTTHRGAFTLKAQE